MISIFLTAWALVVATVTIHTVGLSIVIRSLMKRRAALPTHFWPITRLLTGLAWSLILIHLAEIALWGLFYYWKDCMPDLESAFYFAGVTYTTTGYGDLLLPPPWRMLGPVEALTGILMCGLSAAVFFAVVSRIFMPRLEANEK
jgi:Ion channel